MSASAVYVAIALTALLAVLVVGLVLGRRPDASTLTPLTALSFGMVAAGIAFGDTRAVGYAFFAAGVGLAVVDLLRKRGPRGPGPGGGAGDDGSRSA